MKIVHYDCLTDVRLLSMYCRDVLGTVCRTARQLFEAVARAALKAVSRQAPRVVRRPPPAPNRRQSAVSPGRPSASHNPSCRPSTKCAARYHLRVITAITNSRQPALRRSRKLPQPARNQGANYETEATRRPTSRFTLDRHLRPINRLSRRLEKR